MQFLVTGYDGSDPGAAQRRLNARPAHLTEGEKMKAAGNLLFAVALTDSQDRMIGSVLVCEFQSKQALESWLETEPYVTGKVWQEIEIVGCKVGATFAKQ